ncbi:unnamed protein product [Choristocarpus tenellus]
MTVGNDVLEGTSESILGTVLAFKNPAPGAPGTKGLDFKLFSDTRMEFKASAPQIKRRKKGSRASLGDVDDGSKRK